MPSTNMLTKNTAEALEAHVGALIEIVEEDSATYDMQDVFAHGFPADSDADGDPHAGYVVGYIEAVANMLDIKPEQLTAPTEPPAPKSKLQLVD